MYNHFARETKIEKRENKIDVCTQIDELVSLKYFKFSKGTIVAIHI